MSDLLAKHGITAYGFLPSKTPLDTLSDPYYRPWESVIHNLPELIREERIRSEVDNLEILCAGKLTTEEEWQRAYGVLSFMAHGYIWGGEYPVQVLPPAISLPLLDVSKHLELPPVLTYAAGTLWNFTCVGENFTDMEKLRTLHTFTGTESESWFLLISVAMEARVAPVIPTMLRALDAVATRDYVTILSALQKLTACIKEVGNLLERMYERCDPMIFYHQVRPFFAGGKNMEAAGLPRGVFYDERNGGGEWRQLRGGSNGQSSSIQFFDVILGVEHRSNGGNSPHAMSLSDGRKPMHFHEEVREYMPGPHRRFLQDIARRKGIRELVMEPLATSRKDQLIVAYTAATDELTRFRNKHIKIVTRYIVLPSKQPPPGPMRKKDLASVSTAAAILEKSNGHQIEGLTGTGGTTLLPFLKQVRDETLEAGMMGVPEVP